RLRVTQQCDAVSTPIQRKRGLRGGSAERPREKGVHEPSAHHIVRDDLVPGVGRRRSVEPDLFIDDTHIVALRHVSLGRGGGATPKCFHASAPVSVPLGCYAKGAIGVRESERRSPNG